jgi:hypothetical protein
MSAADSGSNLVASDHVFHDRVAATSDARALSIALAVAAASPNAKQRGITTRSAFQEAPEAGGSRERGAAEEDEVRRLAA